MLVFLERLELRRPQREQLFHNRGKVSQQNKLNPSSITQFNEQSNTFVRLKSCETPQKGEKVGF